MLISIPTIEGLQSQPLRIAKVDGDLDLVVLEAEAPAPYMTIVMSRKDLAGMLARLDDVAFRAATAKANGRWATSLAALKVPTSGIREERGRHKAELDALVQACRDEEQGTAREDADDAIDRADHQRAEERERQYLEAGDSLVKELAQAWDAPEPSPYPEVVLIRRELPK